MIAVVAQVGSAGRWNTGRRGGSTMVRPGLATADLAEKPERENREFKRASRSLADRRNRGPR